MIASSRRWLYRNRSRLAIGAGVVGAAYVAGQYVLSKIRESSERAQLDRLAKDNIRRRFEQNQTDCTITVLALLPTLTENALEALPVEQLTHELQQKRAERLARTTGDAAPSEASSMVGGDSVSLSSFQSSNFVHASQYAGDGSQGQRKSKAQLWNELKVTSITRSLTLIYSMSLLTLLTRIQLNLLGRLNYVSSVVAMAQPPSASPSNSISLEDHDVAGSAAHFGNDFETNRRYLTFSWYLLHKGYAEIMAKVRTSVEQVFGTISPTEGLTSDRLRELILEVRKKVEGATEQERYATKWLPYILPPREEEESVLIESGVISPPSSSSAESPDQPSTTNANPERPRTFHINTASGPLRQLLDETADLIESPTFTRIHTLILNAMFSHLVDTRIREQVYPQQQPPHSPSSSISGVLQTLQPRIQELDSAVTVVPAEPRVRLANILAIMTRQAHVIGNGNNPPNEYLTVAEQEVKELEAFAAVIYTTNQQPISDESRSKVAGDTQASKTGTSFAAGNGDTAEQADEMVESQLESAWEKVAGSSFTSR